MKKKINIGIIGGSGYTGLELVKILSCHKYASIALITSRSNDGKAVGGIYPALKGTKYGNLIFTGKPSAADYTGIDVIFLCLPPHKSMEYVKNMGQPGNIKIIDIGSDFRIKDPDAYSQWYGTKHLMPEMLKDFTYGLPEINSKEIKQSSHIANPGCYPTSVLLGIAPLLESKYELESIIIDSKSGVSGAGKKLKEMYLFGSLDDNFYAYGPTGHRHIGEMEQEIGKLAGHKVNIDFTPHLLPVSRGIFSTIYCKIDNAGMDNIEDKLNNIYEEYYNDSFFIRFLGKTVPSMKDTIGTNLCMIGIAYDKRTETLKIFSTLDNLIKGAAGQAVQNMNLLSGFDEKEGLELSGIFN